MPFTNFKIVQKHFAKVDPAIHRVLTILNIVEWLEDGLATDHFYNLTRNIIYQQLAGKAASTIFGRFENLVGGKVTPEQVLKYTDQELRNIGLSFAKARYVRDLAQKVQNSEVILDKLDTLSDEEVITELTKVKGIGRWTAQMFLLFTLHREDIFSYQDLGLRNGFIKLYNKTNPTQKEIEEVVSRWSPYKSYGALALWHHLDNR